MKEKHMQEDLLIFLKKKFKKAEIIKEYPFIHGTVDIFMKYKNKIYLFEIKTQMNKKLLDQSLKHRKIGDFIFLVSPKPKSYDITLKWTDSLKSFNLNPLWVEHIQKKNIENAIFNKEVNKDIRKRVYGI